MHPADVGYRGLWRRRLLRDANGEDRDTQVWWLQGDGWYVDLRIPPNRPDFSGVTGFDQCNDEQLAWLARQQGFAGRLEIDGNRLHWQRQIDFQPPSGLADIGEIYWDGECLHERGVLADYEEEWLWEQPATTPPQSWVTADGRGIRLLVGDWVMQMLDHRQPLPESASLLQLVDQTGLTASALFDCTIDFGRIEQSGTTRILASNLPWRTNHELVAPNWDERPLVPASLQAPIDQ